MFYTEITETTCKTVRFSGIYGLFVNNSVKKTNKSLFGYWRSQVRVLSLRPKKESIPLWMLSFFNLCAARTCAHATCAKFDNQAKRSCKLACKCASADCSASVSAMPKQRRNAPTALAVSSPGVYLSHASIPRGSPSFLLQVDVPTWTQLR